MKKYFVCIAALVLTSCQTTEVYYTPMTGTTMSVAQAEAQCQMEANREARAYRQQLAQERAARPVYTPPPSYNLNAQCNRFTGQCYGTVSPQNNSLVQARRNAGRGMESAFDGFGANLTRKRTFRNCMTAKGFNANERKVPLKF